MNYDQYNREERSACAHLFRLLHEGLATNPEMSPLSRVLGLLQPRLSRPDGAGELSARGAVLLTEVALIRDVYCDRKSDPAPFMDSLVQRIKAQEHRAEARIWSELPSILRDPTRTHPNRIAKKGCDSGLLSTDELPVYTAVQAMFNAKPDLALVLDTCLIVFEAKLTKRFNAVQLRRTRDIVEIWANLLFAELGFASPPPFYVVKLGDASMRVDLSWQEIASISAETYPPGDRSRIALEAAAGLVGRKPRESKPATFSSVC